MDSILEQTVVDELRPQFGGELLCPNDEGYETARRIWNGMIDKTPGVIARCTGVADVKAAVAFARERDLPVAVRGGGHSVAGRSLCDRGMMIDLSPMRDVRVDPAKQTARAGPGTRWRDFDRETQAFGLATTGGTNSDTGVAGLALGGGLGWLAGKYGLTCDNLLSADLITADGRFLTASAEENPELFWGLRGGGGNFGIVTSFEFQLHEVGPVLAGMVVHRFDRARDVLRFYRDFSADIPDELNTMTALLTLPEGAQVIAIMVCYNGDLKRGEEILRPLRAFGAPLADEIGPMPYTALQTILDPNFPRGHHYYWKAHLSGPIEEEAIDTLVERFEAVPSPFTAVGYQQLGNAANRVGPDETAFSHRDARYDCLMLSGWEKPTRTEQNIQWTRELYDGMEPLLHPGIYVNALDEEAGDIREAYRPATYERLQALKREYDPDNFFRFNPNIKPDPDQPGVGAP
jgi:FAD/FMN-containing dehydrogenase